jgi:D-alanine transaminase
MNPNISAYLNGEFLPQDQARVSVMDRGFLFGDGVYEVVPVYAGHLFRLREHLQRLDRSLAAVRMTAPLSHAEWSEVLERLLADTDAGDGSVYLQVTRGAPAQRDHRFPTDSAPTVFATLGKAPGVDPETRQKGVAAITLADVRWQRCDIKAITLLANTLARQQAADAGAEEAILLRNACAWEGSSSNLFVVRGNVLSTPPKGPELLAGITREVVLELAAQHSVPFRQAPVSEADLRAAEEIWITSSSREITPVTRLDDAVVGNGSPGPLWKRMYDYFQQQCSSA